MVKIVSVLDMAATTGIAIIGSIMTGRCRSSCCGFEVEHEESPQIRPKFVPTISEIKDLKKRLSNSV